MTRVVSVSVNAIGPAAMSAEDAAGTTYDGATPLLTAAGVTAGAHMLYKSQGVRPATTP